jgi:hypothetical protein
MFSCQHERITHNVISDRLIEGRGDDSRIEPDRALPSVIDRLAVVDQPLALGVGLALVVHNGSVAAIASKGAGVMAILTMWQM